MNSTIVKIVDSLYEMRLETLLSVDDLVTAVVKALEVYYTQYLLLMSRSVFPSRMRSSLTTPSFSTTVTMVCVFVCTCACVCVCMCMCVCAYVYACVLLQIIVSLH